MTVTNRDSYGSRLDGFKVAVGNDVSTKGGNGNAPCGGGYKVSIKTRIETYVCIMKAHAICSLYCMVV